MENLNSIEKVTLLLSIFIVAAANLFLLVSRLETKKFRKSITIIFFLGSSFFVNAQDTIFFTNSSIVSSKIYEVGISEIKYKRFDNLTGPNYSVAKSEIKKIRYSNGVIDTTSFLSIGVKTPTLKPSVKMMVLSGTDIYYNGKIQGEFAIHRLISTHALSENQLNIVKDIKRIKQSKKGYDALGTGLFVTGFAVPAAVTLGALSQSSNTSEPTNVVQSIVAGAIAGVLLRVSGQVVLKIGKNKSKARQREFIQKYNQNEIIY